MNPATPPEAAVAARLNGSSSLVTGTNLFSGPEQAVGTGIPSAAVFCRTYGGLSPVPYLGNSADLRTFSVQVLIRGDQGDYDTTRTLARTLWERLHRYLGAGGGYIDFMCQQADPVDLGSGDDDRPRFAINLDLRYSG